MGYKEELIQKVAANSCTRGNAYECQRIEQILLCVPVECTVTNPETGEQCDAQSFPEKFYIPDEHILVYFTFDTTGKRAILRSQYVQFDTDPPNRRLISRI